MLALSANSAWNVLNFRMKLIGALESAGYPVCVLVPGDPEVAQLRSGGVRVCTVPMQPTGVSPIADAMLTARYVAALRRISPAAFLPFTAKPNIYGSLAAAALGIPVINNITGLGNAFIRKGLLGWVAERLYRLALRSSRHVFFHNSDDLEHFVRRRLVKRERASVLPGSGIDLDHFHPVELPRRERAERFLFVGRLLWEKGVAELVEAARMVKRDYPQARFQLLGATGDDRRAVPAQSVDRWVAEGTIDYLGTVDDVRPFVAESDCVVLPSWREGMPRALLEASAMGRPIIGTDAPGCRQLIDDGVNGFLCEPHSGQSLARAVTRVIELPLAQREQMARRARERAEQQFGDSRVIDAYLQALGQHSIGPGRGA